MKLAIMFMLIFLTGCSIASNSIRDIDDHINEIVKEDKNKIECIAGFYSGIGYSTDNLRIAKAIQTLDSMVDNKQDKEYIRCKTKGLEVSILAIAGEDKFNGIVKKIASLGILR